MDTLTALNDIITGKKAAPSIGVEITDSNIIKICLAFLITGLILILMARASKKL